VLNYAGILAPNHDRCTRNESALECSETDPTPARQHGARAHLCKLHSVTFAVRPLRGKRKKQEAVAIYHLSIKTISRSAGRSATGAAAYRIAARIEDERTGEIHDYTKKAGVASATLILPENAPEWASDRAALWNAVEQAETRKNSTVAREFEIALPAELSAAERQRLAVDFAAEIVARHGCAVDVAIHAPGREGDNRNHHAHLLCSTRRLTPEGFTAKTRELDDRKSGEVERWRERFAGLTNARLRDNGHETRVDHRTLEAQGIAREPTQHLGPAATGYERRTGQPSRLRQDWEHTAAQRLAQAKEAGALERQTQQADREILDLSGDLAKALAERDSQRRELQQIVAAGKDDFRALFAQHKRAEQEKKREAEAKAAQLKAEQERRQRIAHEKAEEQRWMKLRAESPGFAKKLAGYAAIKEKAAQDGLTPEQSAAVMTRVRDTIDKSLEQEAAEARRIQEEKQQQERERQRRIERHHDRGMSR